MRPEIITIDIPARSPELAPVATNPHRVLCYQWGNPAAAETVLCVHGLTRNARDFDFLALALAERYRVICIDMPGRGLSDWLPNATDYNYATYIADIQHMVDSLKLTRMHWVGTSMGGIIAMMMEVFRPGLIQSLVLNDIGCFIPAAGLKRILSYAGTRMEFASREMAESTLREICAPFGIVDENHWQHLFTHSIQNRPDGKVRLAYDPAIATALSGAEEVADINLWPYWKSIMPIPILLIRGAESDILSYNTAMEMQRQHPKLTLHEIANVGHAPALMASDQIALIGDWLSRVA